MLEIAGGSMTNRQWGFFMVGLSTGITSGMNPLVRGLTTAGCFLLN
jgi:hypothetical protein